MKVRPVRASCFVLTNGWKSGWTDMTKQIAAFRNSATTSKNLDTPFLLLVAASLPKRHLYRRIEFLNSEHLFPIIDAIRLHLYTS